MCTGVQPYSAIFSDRSNACLLRSKSQCVQLRFLPRRVLFPESHIHQKQQDFWVDIPRIAQLVLQRSRFTSISRVVQDIISSYSFQSNFNSASRGYIHAKKHPFLICNLNGPASNVLMVQRHRSEKILQGWRQMLESNLFLVTWAVFFLVGLS